MDLLRESWPQFSISKELTYATIASWLGPALDTVFTKKNIKSAFLATGFWDETLSGPNVERVFSQYETVFPALPIELRKMN